LNYEGSCRNEPATTGERRTAGTKADAENERSVRRFPDIRIDSLGTKIGFIIQHEEPETG